MKFLLPIALLAVVTVGSALPIWLPLPQQPSTPVVPTALTLTPVSTNPAAPEASQLVRFVTSPVAVPTPSILTDLYFYEGQYVRRGQVLAKLKVRATKAVAYLNAAHDGVLSRPQLSVGELLTPDAPLTTLTDQTRLLVRLHPAVASRLHPGDSVQVSLASAPGAPVRGKITSWTSAGPAAPLVAVQLRKSVAGASAGASLLLAGTIGRPEVALLLTR
ncbi:HlyD family efflux transporter periplasmic adaptor subunit [Hymenobacter persicinus]|uniref:HlyD family efflux transporter periplasmic adaptor subunit n=1 Tax=Hymenobacter persicinus TaxID=2025506 RepID=A0A4Q5LHV6_9BACT|nr:HlyD family efflux transporter periplasmic adaptor subunit [Hymenobacter persicinus]RYU82107.1 HlyD family efflux transporter periplasmic adaptor subunit [Hymenobacter persicinus]